MHTHSVLEAAKRRLDDLKQKLAEPPVPAKKWRSIAAADASKEAEATGEEPMTPVPENSVPSTPLPSMPLPSTPVLSNNANKPNYEDLSVSIYCDDTFPCNPK